MKVKITKKASKDQVVNDLGLSGLTKTQQDKIIGLLTEALTSRVAVELWKKMTAKQKEDLQEFLESAEDEKIPGYIEHNVPEFSELAQKATKKLIADFKKKKSSLAEK